MNTSHTSSELVPVRGAQAVHKTSSNILLLLLLLLPLLLLLLLLLILLLLYFHQQLYGLIDRPLPRNICSWCDRDAGLKESDVYWSSLRIRRKNMSEKKGPSYQGTFASPVVLLLLLEA